jgi:hypothetical protein
MINSKNFYTRLANRNEETEQSTSVGCLCVSLVFLPESGSRWLTLSCKMYPNVVTYLGVRLQMGHGLVNGFIDHMYTPLGTTLCRSRARTDYCALSITVSTSRYLVTASNGGRSPYSGFPNYPRASATSFSQQQLTMTETAVLWPTPRLAAILH